MRRPVHALVDVQPAEEDVAHRLHRALAGDDALTCVLVRAVADVLLEHRCLRLLDLHDHRVVAVATEQERDPRMRADAPDSDHLAGEVDERVPLEEGAPLVVQRPGVRDEEPPQPLLEPPELGEGEKLPGRHD